MNKLILTFALCFCAFFTVTACATNQIASSGNKAETQLKNNKSPIATKYKVGQEWSYKTRSNEEKSTFIVVKIDEDPKLGTIIHIALRDLKMKSPNSPDGYADSANHLPFAEAAINKSAVKLLKENVDLPDYEEGYKLWRKSFEERRAGIYHITIAEAIDVMEASLNQ